MGSSWPNLAKNQQRPPIGEPEQGFASEPQILPPGGGPGPQTVRKPRSSWSVAPATYVLLGINCAVFLWMAVHGVSLGTPTTEQLMHFGANNAGSVLIDGEWWRIVTAMFVHVGILHLATNMWCLWNLGMLAEPLMGSFGVVAVYILTGAAGNLLSTDINWLYPIREGGGVYFPAGAGASGAVFGIAGALIVLLKSNRLPVPPEELKKLRRSVIYFAALNLVLGLSISGGNLFLHSGLNIDNMAHLGGFACGLLFAAPMVPRLGSPRTVFQRRLRMAVGLVVCVLVLFSFYIDHIQPPAGLVRFLNS
jgi:rhomboid protease GluP